MRFCFFAFLIFLSLLVQAQVTNVQIDLKVIDNDYVAVKVYPPVQSDQITYIIPKVIPGTYLHVNYERFYKDLKAYGSNGQPLRVKRKKNYYHIDGQGTDIEYLSYKVRQSTGAGKVWDNIIGCAGTIFSDNGFLFNFQLINGFFDGYQDSPHKIIVNKHTDLYGATSMKAERSSTADTFMAESYDQLIDSPLLYAIADTASFRIGNNKFSIAVRSEKRFISANQIKPKVEQLMHAVDSFSGFTTPGDYYFLFYYIDRQRVDGKFSGFGLGSALEHKNSSVYYYSDNEYYDTLFRNLDHIVTHEYYHTYAPLNLHTDRIENFDFAEPKMSSHTWFYEGLTDYLSSLVNEKYDLQNSLRPDLNEAAEYAQNRKARSMTKSSEEILATNLFGFIPKVLQLGNFYAKGKLIAFGMDMEIRKRSEGKRNLLSSVQSMYAELGNTAIPENEFLDQLAEYTYPDLRQYFERYIEGEELPPFEEYFDLLGWNYHSKGSQLPSYYKKIQLAYNFDHNRYRVNKVGKNTLGLKKGDLIISINGEEIDLNSVWSRGSALSPLRQPMDPMASIQLAISRDGKLLTLVGKSTLSRKLKYPITLERPAFSSEQKMYRAWLLDR